MTTPGARVVALLGKSLGKGVEWTEAERATLNLICAAVDRAEVLKGLFGAEVAKVPVSTRRVTEL